MSGGISRRQVRIGSPNVRALPLTRGVRRDREPERARADDCGVDAIHVSQPSAFC